MSNWWLRPEEEDCGCRIYVQATLCSGEPDPGYKGYVHQDDLPETAGVFLYDGVCWSVDPDGEKVCFPSDGTSHRIVPSYDYETCDDCTGREDDYPSNPTPPTPPLPPGVGGGYVRGEGSSGGSGADVGPWKQAYTCSGHAGWPGVLSNLYVTSESVGETAKYFRHRGICYYVSPSSSEIEELPSGATGVSIVGTFYDCDKCTKGIQCTLCPGQTNPQYAADVWVSVVDPPEDARIFWHGGYCYEYDPEGAEAVVPYGSTIVGNIPDEYESCEACGPGRQATLCPNQITPSYQVWVHHDHLPAENTITFQYKGLCYWIAPGETSPIPPDAEVTIPPTVSPFASCDECICGLATGEPERGVKAGICSLQHIHTAKNLWVREVDIPSTLWVWRDEYVCYYVSPSMAVRDIPVDAIITKPKKQYSACFECTTTFVYNPFPPTWPPNPPPNWPPPTPPPEDDNRVIMAEWYDCEGATPTGVYDWWYIYQGTAVRPLIDVPSVLEGKPGLVTTKCYYLVQVEVSREDLRPGCRPSFPKRIYQNCEECFGAPSAAKYKLTPGTLPAESSCGYCGVSLTPKYFTVQVSGVDGGLCPDCFTVGAGVHNMKYDSVAVDGTYVLTQTGPCLWSMSGVGGYSYHLYNRFDTECSGTPEGSGSGSFTIALERTGDKWIFGISTNLLAIAFYWEGGVWDNDCMNGRYAANQCICGSIFLPPAKYPASSTGGADIKAGDRVNPNCAPGGNPIYTDDEDVAPCLDRYAKLNDGVCYYVELNPGSNPPDGDVAVVGCYDTLEDCCA